MADLLKSKTFWTGAAGLVSAGAGYATGEFTSAAATQVALNSLLGIFLRAAIFKAS